MNILLIIKTKVIDKAKAFFSDLSIKVKLLLLFFMFSVILISSVSFVLYNKSSIVIDHQSKIYSEMILMQIVDRTEKLMDEVMKISMPIVTNPEIQNNDLHELGSAELLGRMPRIAAFFGSIINMKDDICSIYACTDSGVIFSSNVVSEGDQRDYKSYMVYRKALEAGTKPIWLGVHENEFVLDRNRHVFSFCRSLYDISGFKPFGALIINIPNEILKKICITDLDTRVLGNVYIIDKQGHTIFNASGSTGTEPVEREYIKDIINQGEEKQTFFFDSNTESYTVRYITSSKTDWTYIAEIPLDYLYENTRQVKKYVYLIVLLSSVLSVFAAYLISSYFTVPFRKMIKTMKTVESGDFDISLGIKNRSEIGQLAASYTKMIGEIKKLIQRLEQEHSQKRKAELNVLQAQITPHFLYNTLNSIKCLAYVQKVRGIEEMTSSLIDLLQLSISKSTVYISIAEEADIAKKYLTLQKFRYGDKVKTIFEIDDQILNNMTLKLILQPLIENSLYHGFESIQNRQCIIEIKIFKSDMGICFEVKDNGIGMDNDRINSIFHENKPYIKKFSGIGVKNIDERIKLHFGENYGLSYRSIPGEYTIASVIIPIIIEGEVEKCIES